MKKRCLALLCSLCLLTGQTWAAGTGYPDINGDEWFAGAVEEMTQKGIMTGVEGGLFAPYEPVTRATVITVLWRLEGSPRASVAEPFSDAENDGSFGGRDPVTREQLACFLYRYAEYKGEPLAEGALGLFSDTSAISPWAEDAMRHAVGAGILQGNDKGTVEPQGIANRAALATMLQRMLTPAAG